MLAAVAAPLAAQGAETEWATYRHDNDHTGRSEVSFDPRQLQLAWQSPQGYVDPVVAGDAIYSHSFRSGDTRPVVSSFNRTNGSVNWTYADSFYEVSPATVIDGLVVYEASRQNVDTGQMEYGLYVHDATTGTLKYRTPINYGSQNPVTVGREADGTLVAYVSTSGIGAYQLGDTSANLKWGASSGSSPLSAGAVVGDSIVGGNSTKAWAYDRSTGTGNAFWAIGGSTGGMPAGVAYDRNSGRLYVNTQSNGIRAFEYSGQSDITPLWATSVWYGDSKPPAIAEDGSLYIVRGGTGQLVELDPATGLPLRTSAATDFFTDDPPVLQAGYIWVSARHGSFATELRVLDADTFETVRSFADAPDYVLLRPPVLAEGTMVMPLYSGVGGSKTFQVYLVPEPASAITLLVALGGVACCRLRRISADRPRHRFASTSAS